MTMISDRDLLTFRQSYYELFVSLFWKEPPGALLLTLSKGLRERADAARNLHPLLAQGWEETGRFLNGTPLENLEEAVTDEYTRLFIGPQAPPVNPYESFYLTGRLMERPLANLRTLLRAIGIEKQEEYAEPEDFLAFELEVMRWLIGKQGNSTESEEEKRWLERQAEFLKQHLLVWAPTCAQDIEKAEGANFYRGVAMILRGFLEVERTLFPECGVDKVAALEDVRQRYGAIPRWKGPTFEMPSDKPETRSGPKNK